MGRGDMEQARTGRTPPGTGDRTPSSEPGETPGCLLPGSEVIDLAHLMTDHDSEVQSGLRTPSQTAPRRTNRAAEQDP